MAYSSVGRPIFYIDNYLYRKTLGVSTENYNYLSTNPSFQKIYTEDTLIPANLEGYDFSGNMKFFIAILNHDLYGQEDQGTINPFTITNTTSDLVEEDVSSNFTEVLNGGSTGNGFTPLNGSTILTSSNEYNNISMNVPFNVGSINTGVQYTMPHSPDLKLNMEIEFDGIKTITTSSGGSISNVQYTGNPLWTSGGSSHNPFEVYGSYLNSARARRNGRKSWSLKFSYVSDTDLFASNPKTSSYTEHPNDSTYESSDLLGSGSNSYFGYNIDTDDSFYAQVWNKTLGGALPFMFQPDSNNNDDFYMCRFEQNSLRASQSAYKVYDISLKIVESW